MKFKDMTVSAFAEALASKAPVPGGGGVSALVGALGASLASMVGNLTSGKKKYAQYEGEIQSILTKAEELRVLLLALADADAEAFEPLSRAYSIPKDAPDRTAVMDAALRTAAQAWAGCMFGKEQTEQLAAFYGHNYLSVLNACTGYFTQRLSRLLLKAQRKRLRR